mgnify:CR=1 FL=1
MRDDDDGPGGSALSDGLGPLPKRGFIERTNADYSAWCRTHYAAHALDARGMASLHGLWAWQEQEKHIASAVAAERERCAKLCEWLPLGTGLQGKTFAEAIRGEGMGGKMAQDFKA